MTDVRFCKVQFEEPPLAPERRPGKDPIRPRSGPRRGTIKSPHVEGVSGPPGAAWGRQARGGRVGGRDRRGQRRTAGDLDLLPAWVGHPPAHSSDSGPGTARHRPRSARSFHRRSTGLGSQETHRFGRRDHGCW